MRTVSYCLHGALGVFPGGPTPGRVYMLRAIRFVVLYAAFAFGNGAPNLRAQDLSWVDGAMSRSKQLVRESLPAWQYDPRVAAGSFDATLNAVATASADRIWAVGDRGLILASQNGGRTWIQQNSGTTLNLYGVTFVNEQEGFAVGGSIQPLSHMSIGIVVATDNAGATWRNVHKGPLPRLTGLSIAERGLLKVWGDYSIVYGSAVLDSQDRGQSWQPVASPFGHVQSVARHGRGLQLGVDRAGRLSQLPSQSPNSLRQLAAPTAPIRSLEHTGTQWLAVGDAGTLATSRDGVQWIDHSVPLTPQARIACNFRCAATFEEHVWVAGSPGTILLHSTDSGNTWKVQPTDQKWPINAIRFFDRHRGWAVTDAGTILATRDGGETWFPQRAPVERLGVQAFAASPSRVSWPALADAAWQRQATSLSILHRENTEDAVDFLPDAPAILSALGVQAGLVSARLSSAYPLPDHRVRNRLATHELYRNATAGAKPPSPTAPDLCQQLVLQLRTGRPTVVLVDGPLTDEANTQLTDAVSRAITHAARHEADQYSWLRTELLLEPWQVSKLFSSTSLNKADFTIAHDQLLRDSGLSVSDVLGPLFGLTGTRNDDSRLRCLLAGSGGVTRNSLFHMSDRLPDSTRPVDLSNVGNLQLVMGRVHRDKAWQSLLPSDSNIEESKATWLRKLESLIEKTPRHEVGPALVQLAEAYAKAEKWSRWYAILQRAADYAPQSDAARWSLLAALQYGASDERLAWEVTRGSSTTESASGNRVQLASTQASNRSLNAWESTPFENELPTTASQAPITNPVQVASNIASPLNEASQVVSASASSLQASSVRTVAGEQAIDAQSVPRVATLKRAVAEFTKLAETDKALMLRPDIQLAHFARRRALAELAGEPAPDAGLLQQLASGSHLAGWQQVAEQELVLASGRPTLPAWTARARATDTPPQLDGLANDACWQQAVPIELTSPFNADALKATAARFAYDAEYLYLFVNCPRVTSATNTAQNDAQALRQTRKYDMPLDGSDYVQLNLDTDRDYSSASELAVSQTGQTFDRCCHISQWNPRWHVDTHQEVQYWNAELAIKLTELTTAPSVGGRAWAISVFRYIPQWDVQSWSQLRSYNPRQQGNGLLVFER